MWDAKRDVKVGEDLLLMHKYLFRVYTQGRNSSQKPSKCVRLQTNNWFISRAWDMRSEQALFIAHATNIQVMSAYPVKYIRKKNRRNIYFFHSVWCLFVAQACDWQERYLLWKSISAAVSMKSQQRLAFGCQLKEDTNYWYSASIWKRRCFMWPALPPDGQTTQSALSWQ